MALIQVTPELLRAKATEVRNLRNEHDDSMTRLKSLVHALNEIWKGESQDAFVAKFDGMQSTFTNFSEMLEDYAKAMDAAANRFEQADQAGKN